MFADVSEQYSFGGSNEPSNIVNNYLADLERALRGADPALVHDALIDAETHLRAAIAAGHSAVIAVNAYGTPSDIALAYFREQFSAARGGMKDQSSSSSSVHESKTSTDTGSHANVDVSSHAKTDASSHGNTEASSDAKTEEVAAGSAQCNQPTRSVNKSGVFVTDSQTYESARPVGFLRCIPIVGIYFDPYAWGSVVFLTFGFVFALVAFMWVMILGSLAIGLLPTLLGIPLLISLLGSARVISLFFGKVIEALVGIRMPRRAYRVDVSGVNGFWRRIWLWIKDIRGWLTTGFLIGNFPVALCFFCVIVSLLAASILLLAIGIGGIIGNGLIGTVIVDEPCTIHVLNTPYVSDENGMFHVPLHVLVLLTFIGFSLLTATLWLSKGVAFVYAQVVKAIQVVRPQSLSQQ